MAAAIDASALFPSGETPEHYGDRDIATHWKSSLLREYRLSAPAWERHLSLCDESERARLNKQSDAAKSSIWFLMRENEGKFDDWQISAYELAASMHFPPTAHPANTLAKICCRLFQSEADVRNAISRVQRGLDACEKLNIRFQSLVKCLLPCGNDLFRNADAAVRKFREMNLGLPKCNSVPEIVELYKKTGTSGMAQFVLTKTPLNFHSTQEHFRRRGLSARFGGIPGNCRVTVNRLKPRKASIAPPTYQLRSSWPSYIQAELTNSKPYWNHYLAGLTPRDRKHELAGCENAAQTILMIMKKNGGMITLEQFAEYQLGNDPDERVQSAITACRQLRIPLQTLVAGPLVEDPSDVREFRAMDLGLTKLRSIADLAIHFKDKQSGETAVLLGGPPVRQSAVMQARNIGLIIQAEGVLGNRLIRFREFSDITKRKRIATNQSKRDGESFLFRHKVHLLREGGPTVYMEGNHATLVRQLSLYFGPRSCSVFKSADQKGWNVRLNRVTKV